MNRTIEHPDSDGFSWFSKDADGVFFCTQIGTIGNCSEIGDIFSCSWVSRRVMMLPVKTLGFLDSATQIPSLKSPNGTGTFSNFQHTYA